jgi:tetratricopeptide (TPR) repeat protein
LIDERQFREAVEPAAEASRLRPAWAAAWWSYGVALKHAQRWAECLAACDRALALDPDDSQGPCWNAGIAATALGDWPRAREAWSRYGIDVPDGAGPLEMAIGHACVRVSPHSAPEVVYARRIDPCRARIVSVPLAESQRRYGDLVLHDGEPRGTRGFGDAQVTVFDELALLVRSAYGTWQVSAVCDTPEDRDALLALYTGVDGEIEDWTESIAMLCAQCSLGEGCRDHDPPEAAWRRERRLGLALRDDRELQRLRRLGLWWRRGIRDVSRVL